MAPFGGGEGGEGRSIVDTDRVKKETVERWVWLLVYGGLLVLCLGVFVRRADAPLGWGLMGFGGLAAVAGFALIYVRSRMQNER